MLNSKRFKVRVHTSKGLMYWTWSSSTVKIEDAAIFTEETMPELFKQSSEQSYIEKIYL